MVQAFSLNPEVDLAIGGDFETLLSNESSDFYTTHCPEYERSGQEGCLHFFNMSAPGSIFLGCAGNPKKNQRVRVNCRYLDPSKDNFLIEGQSWACNFDNIATPYKC